jgi:hypothetical protein
MRKAAAVFLILLAGVTAGSLTTPSDWLAARVSGPVTSTSSADSSVGLLDGPSLESATDNSAIVRWITKSVDGTTVRYGVVHYGLDPRHLEQTSKSQNRYNRGLPTMIYRVQLSDLEPGLTYYYWVEATDANGVGQGIHSEVLQFTTPSR